MQYSVYYFKNLNDLANIINSQSIEGLENQEDAFNLASDYSKKGNNAIIFEGNIIKDYTNKKFVAMYEPLGSTMFENFKHILLNGTF